jgi:hypothetical protein
MLQVLNAGIHRANPAFGEISKDARTLHLASTGKARCGNF